MLVSEFLSQQFHQRKSKNPRFSLRSFAKLLDADPSFLSKVLKDQRLPSHDTLKRWAAILKLAPEETNVLLSCLAAQKPKVNRQPVSFQPICIDTFDNHYAWFYPIILEAMAHRKFRRSFPSIAKNLNLSPEELQKTLDEMKTLGLVQDDPLHPGTFKVGNLTTTHISSTSEKRKMIQAQYLEKASEAIFKFPMDLRDNNTVTFPLALKDIPEVKEVLRQTIIKISKISSKSTKTDAIYNLSMALYPVLLPETE